jgi:hypothetical protein
MLIYGGIPQPAFGASIPFAKISYIALFRIFMQFSSFSYDVLPAVVLSVLNINDVRNILIFVTWILPQHTARTFFSNQSKAGLARFENSNTKSIDHSYLGSIKFYYIVNNIKGRRSFKG